jgi:hypothetical protein
VLRGTEWRRQVIAERSQARRADRDQQGLGGFSSRIQIRNSALDEIGPRQSLRVS